MKCTSQNYECRRCPYVAQCREATREGQPVLCEKTLVVPVVDYHQARQAGYRAVSGRRKLSNAELVFGVLDDDPGARACGGYLLERVPGSGPTVAAIRFVSL